MSTSKHQGHFARSEDPEELEGDSTGQGDVENVTAASSGVDEHRLGRTN